MICQNMKELCEVCDKVISKFMSLNIPIEDTENEHSLMVFILERKGYKLKAYSSTRKIKSCIIDLDDCFSIDEILQDLHTMCEESIDQSKRYSVKDMTLCKIYD